jgi:hypothetical protein
MEGWDDLRDADNAHLAANQASQEEINTAFVRCFSTEAGQTVLDFLRGMTLEQPSWYPGEDASHGYAREGQNSIVREILRRIQKGREA